MYLTLCPQTHHLNSLVAPRQGTSALQMQKMISLLTFPNEGAHGDCAEQDQTWLLHTHTHTDTPAHLLSLDF